MDTYSRSRVPRNGVATNPVELKPSASERDENRNETLRGLHSVISISSLTVTMIRKYDANWSIFES